MVMGHDYSKIGFKAGLEIHQQLDTNKLFSHTPSLLRSDEPDYRISRKLHAIAGEQGKIDIAVQHEASLDKEFIYEGYNDTISLVELDEAPPEMINQEALKIAFEGPSFSKFCGASHIYGDRWSIPCKRPISFHNSSCSMTP